MHFPMLVKNNFVNAAQNRSRHWLPFSLIILMALVPIFLNPTAAYAADVPSANSVSDLACFAVADELFIDDNDPDNQQDTLTVLDPVTGDTEIIGPTGTSGIEAISFGPNSEIFAADGKRLGTLDKETGAFTPRSRNFGIVGGIIGGIPLEISIDDVDGLAFDLAQNILLGAQRLPQAPLPAGGPPPDILFAIDPVTGRHIPDYFGAGVDYVVVPEVVDDENVVMDDLDDIQFNPVSGELYGVVNYGGASGVLVTIVITPGLSSIDVHPIGTFRDAGDNDIIDDIEGISFGNDGTLYVSTGDNFTGDRDDLNALYAVNPATAQTTFIGFFPTGPKDYEALACLSAEAAIVLRKYTNGPGQAPDDADTPTGPAIQVGDTVTWTYIFTNTGVLDLTDFVLEDDQLGLIDTSLTCVPPDDTLAPGFSLTCTVTGIATAGQYANVATVTANSIPTPLFPQFTVSDTNPSHYIGTVVLPPDELAALGDRVWHDVDNDGVQDADEPGLQGVTVTLLDGSCSTETGLSTETDEDGLYIFTDLDAGSYCVQFTLPDGYTFTTRNVGADDADSDANPVDGTSGPVTLAEGEINLTIDAGLVTDSTELLASLGDLVWFDANLNGLQDNVGTEGGEEGVPNVRVNLIPVDASAAEVSASSVASPAAVAVTSTLTTDENGRYLFDGLQPGSYYVQFIGPAEYGFTLPDAENNAHDDADSDGQVPLVTLSVDDNTDEVQAGQDVTYTISYTNTHDTLPADNAALSTTVPAGTTFVAAGSSTGWVCADVTPGSVCRLPLASVPAGASGSVDFVAHVQEVEDPDDVPPAIFLLVRLIQSREADTQIVTLAAGEQNLTLDAGLVPIQNSGDIEAGVETPTTIVPTSLPPNEQPQQQGTLYLPSLRDAE